MNKKLFIKFITSALLLLVFFNLEMMAQPCIQTFPYVEDFETGPAWTNVSVANNDWAWGSPNHTFTIHSAGSGNKCWSVGGLTGAFYNFWEQSYVQSPCFNFTNLTYPHIKFKLFYDSEYHFDGGNLQYSLNGGTTWINVGAYNDPPDCNTANWYNYHGINYLNNPAWIPVNDGWCGNVEAGGVGWDPTSPTTNCQGGNGLGHWVTAEHCLTGCAGQPNVLLRFTFGAGYSCNNFDGFAFDSVAVSNGIPNSATFTYTCGGPGALNFNAANPACPTNTYSWNFGDPASGFSNAGNGISSGHTFSAAGTYTVTLIASGGNCNPPDTIHQVVNVLTASVTASSSVSCNGGNNGSATAAPVGGTGPFTYSWSPSGGNASSANNLSAGNYTVSINGSGAGNCPATASVNIIQPAPLTATLTTTNGTGCGGNGSATVTAAGGSNPYSYSWTPSGGNSNMASGLTSGSYSVLVQDINSCTVITSASITSSNTITAQATQTNVTCFGGSNGTATCTSVMGGSGNYSYSWMPAGGNAAGAVNLSAGSYSLTITDNTGGCQVTVTVQISQPAAPVAVIANSLTVCAGQSANLLAVASGGVGPNYTYSWSPGSGSGATLNIPSASNSAYSVIAIDSHGCPSPPAVANLSVLPPLSVLVSGNDTICPGSNAHITATGSGGNGGPYTYQWQPGNLSGNPVTVHPLHSTIYTVTLSDGCTSHPATAAALVDVLQVPSLSFNANPGSGCAPICVTFAGVASQVPGNNVVSWAWNFGDGQTATGFNGQHCYNFSGNYSVGLYGITQMGCLDSVVQYNVIKVYPNPHADFSADPFQTDIYENTIHFTDESQTNIVLWNWTLQSGVYSNSQNPTYTYAQEGTYPVKLVVVNSNGCRDSIIKDVVIVPVYTFYAPNAFTPNEDGKDENFLPLGTAWNANTYHLWVFDRWGNELFHTVDANQGWDGKKNGDVLQEDVYVWRVSLNDVFGLGHDYKGVISLVR